MNIPIIKRIRSIENWELVEKMLLLESPGLRLENKEELVNQALEAWKESYVHQEKPCKNLPGSTVKSYKTIYYIHGLIHDAPGFNVREELKENMRRSLEDCTVICEDGFSDWIPNSYSFREAEYFAGRKVKKHKTMKSIGIGLVEEAERITCMEELLDFRKKVFKHYFPEPLGMNAFLYLNNKGVISERLDEMPFLLQRYFYEASEAERLSTQLGLEELHVVVGCRHEKPLQYLLGNQYLLEMHEGLY